MLKKVFIYIMGILILGFGVILNTKTGLGVAAINSVPYSLSFMTDLTLGNWTTILYIVFVVFQIIIYRKFDMKVILQIPFSYVMGALLDFYDNLITFIPIQMYQSLIMLVIAILMTGFGVYLVVSMNFIPNPPDGMVNALSYYLKKEFGQVKWIFDCCMMTITIVMTFVVMGKVIGVGIGTVISAIFVGRSIQMFSKICKKYMDKYVEVQS